MSKSKIEWTDRTWNPTIGCAKISAGCKNCYAEKMSVRVNAMGEASGNNDLWAAYSEILKFDYKEAEEGKAKGFNGKIKLMKDRIEQPFRWKKPSMVFVNSMSDLFHEDVPFDFIEDVIKIISYTPQHTYQILTKRPKRMIEFYEWYGFALPKNIWLGVSVEDQKTADERIPLLLKTPAAVRFLSIEPMLSEIDLLDMLLHEPYPQEKIDWIIVGCESGPKKRECKTEWIENLVADLQGCELPVFVKQLNINGKVVKDLEQFPEHLRIREFPNG